MMWQSEHTSPLISFDYWNWTVYLKSNLKEIKFCTNFPT
jgi:hypothetical protein